MRKGLKSLRQQRLLMDLKRSIDGEAFLRNVIGARNITRRGSEIRHSCPLPFGLHKSGDENPSASFNEEKLLFCCHVCGGGSIFWYVQNVKDCSQEEAIRLLREVIRPTEITAAELIAEFEKMWTEDDVFFHLPEYNPRILDPWKMYSVYLDKRGISREVQRQFQTGIDLKNKDKIGERWLEQPRVVIPHFFDGKLVGWTKRLIDNDQIEPRYKHTRGFPKQYTLFNWDTAKTRDDVVVVESPLSVLKMASNGVLNTVATFGANVADEQVELLRCFDELVLAFDGDYAGRNAVRAVYDRLEKFTRVFICHLDDGYDPGDLTKGELESLLKNKEPAAISL